MLITGDLMHSFAGSIIFCTGLGLFFMIQIVGILLFGLLLVRFFFGGLLGLYGGRIFGGLGVGSYETCHQNQWPI